MTLMKAAATLRNTEGGGVRLRLGGPKHSQDKANDTARSTFNTCLASTTLERWNAGTLRMKNANVDNYITKNYVLVTE